MAVRRYVRRRWRLLRGHPVTTGVLAAGALAPPAATATASRVTPEQLSRGNPARVRHRMWVAVDDAETAVAHASSHDAPVAELPSVCRSLRGLADELDASVAPRAPTAPRARRAPTACARQVAELIGACRDVQAAALRAGSDATEPQVRALVRRAADEIDIASAGLARLRSLPHSG